MGDLCTICSYARSSSELRSASNDHGSTCSGAMCELRSASYLRSATSTCTCIRNGCYLRSTRCSDGHDCAIRLRDDGRKPRWRDLSGGIRSRHDSWHGDNGRSPHGFSCTDSTVLDSASKLHTRSCYDTILGARSFSSCSSELHASSSSSAVHATCGARGSSTCKLHPSARARRDVLCTNGGTYASSGIRSSSASRDLFCTNGGTNCELRCTSQLHSSSCNDLCCACCVGDLWGFSHGDDRTIRIRCYGCPSGDVFRPSPSVHVSNSHDLRSSIELCSCSYANGIRSACSVLRDGSNSDCGLLGTYCNYCSIRGPAGSFSSACELYTTTRVSTS